MGTLSENFSWHEFEQSETADRLGLINNIVDFDVRDSVKELVDTVLQPLRSQYGKPLEINSGFRCEALNTAVGGVETSQHRKGEAADVACPDPYALAKLAKELDLPFDQMILYPTFVHFSHKRRGTGAQRHNILYNYRYTGKRIS